MERLENRILTDGTVSSDEILRVDNFLNHQIDIDLLNEIGMEFKKKFPNEKIDKILTVESSGIAIATITSLHFDKVPVVFAKKEESKNLDKDVYRAVVEKDDGSYEMMISKKYIKRGENILIVDDFLAKGGAVLGLVDIIERTDANLVGVAIVIEKSYKEGSMTLKKRGIRVESLACIESLENKMIRFK